MMFLTRRKSIYSVTYIQKSGELIVVLYIKTAIKLSDLSETVSLSKYDTFGECSSLVTV